MNEYAVSMLTHNVNYHQVHEASNHSKTYLWGVFDVSTMTLAMQLFVLQRINQYLANEPDVAREPLSH